MMNTKNVAGTCPREAMTRVLRAEMGVPSGPNLTAAILFGSIENTSDQVFLMLAHQALEQRYDMIMSIWPHSGSASPSNLIIFHRTSSAVEILPVDVALPKDDKALVLVSQDRHSLFFVNERLILSRTACSPSTGIERAVRRGRKKLAEAIAAFEPVDDGGWETAVIG